MTDQPATVRGIPIRMPRDNKFTKSSSTRSIRKIRSGMGSTMASPRPPPRPLSMNLPVIIMKRKRNQEPLDGLLLDEVGRSRSDLDLAKSAAGDISPNEGGDDDDASSTKPNLPARKRKKIAQRGFFQLADTVESAKWDDEAWRRDFNERILAQSKETKKALAAAAGVELPLDSPVVEKTQPTPASSPLKESVSRPNRRYTAVLQESPLKDTQSKAKGKGKDNAAKKELKNDASTGTNASQVDAAVPSSVVYFSAVPVPDSSEDEKDKQEEDEVAAFLPMLQDYLRIHDIPPAKVSADKKRGTKTGLKTGAKIGTREPSTVKDDSETPSQATSDDEYVYDVYFKGNNEPTSSDWNNLSNYGTLIGLPPQAKLDDDDSDEINDNSDYDIDDDSNDEGFYRNDYPEDEDGDDSDLEDSESDDFYNERDDSEEEEDYDHDAPWRH